MDTILQQKLGFKNVEEVTLGKVCTCMLSRPFSVKYTAAAAAAGDGSKATASLMREGGGDWGWVCAVTHHTRHLMPDATKARSHAAPAAAPYVSRVTHTNTRAHETWAQHRVWVKWLYL